MHHAQHVDISSWYILSPRWMDFMRSGVLIALSMNGLPYRHCLCTDVWSLHTKGSKRNTSRWRKKSLCFHNINLLGLLCSLVQKSVGQGAMGDAMIAHARLSAAVSHYTYVSEVLAITVQTCSTCSLCFRIAPLLSKVITAGITLQDSQKNVSTIWRRLYSKDSVRIGLKVWK
jgi:hypothetical protein